MAKTTLFPHYDGRGFIEYLLQSKLAKQINFDDKGLTVIWNDEYDRLNATQKAELIQARLLKTKNAKG